MRQLANSHWPYPRIVAHRGAGKLAPENTLAAMRCGLEYGFHAVEFDVMLSSDGVPILMHDPEFGRTIAGSGSVANSSAAQLMAMDAGAWFGAQFQGEGVPSLQQVLAFCLQQQIWMNIEIKPAPGFEAITGQVVAQTTQAFYAEHGAALPRAAWPLFSSFSFAALKAAQHTAPEIARGVLFERVPANWLSVLQDMQAVALHTNHQALSKELAQQIKAAGYGLFCYTVNQVERAREILAWGVDGFCTDRIDQIGHDFA